jgi:group II intron reverse transcriptase/maturase
VRANTYRPNRPRRFKIAKKDGGLRELSILTISDKVLQRATLNVIDETFEKRFLGISHGYRRNRSVATALQQVIFHRERGLRWVFDADIYRCFESIDHAVLIGLARRVIRDWFVLNLMELWLRAGRAHRNRAVGIPMGAVIAPLWCNIYLHQLDAWLTTRGWTLVRYADDFVILGPTEAGMQRAAEQTQLRLDQLKLRIHPTKSRIVHFDEGFVFLGVNFEKDSYTYTHQKKRIEVTGHSVKLLWRYTPDFYD